LEQCDLVFAEGISSRNINFLTLPYRIAARLTFGRRSCHASADPNEAAKAAASSRAPTKSIGGLLDYLNDAESQTSGFDHRILDYADVFHRNQQAKIRKRGLGIDFRFVAVLDVNNLPQLDELAVR
jgi:hypothetical protein